MAPSRGRGKTKASSAKVPSSRRTRTTRKAKDGLPDVYQEMLAEEGISNAGSDVSERPLKRRKVTAAAQKSSPGSAPCPPTEQDAGSPASVQNGRGPKCKAPLRRLQTIEASESGTEDDSDFGFEDVDLDQPATSGTATSVNDEDGIADVSISIDPTTTHRHTAPVRRKPASAAEKAFRLLVHKTHVLCLLGHCTYANTWCNDITVQQYVFPLLSKKTVTYLQGKEDYTQFQRDRSFRDGLEQASEVFREKFTVNASGLKRARWDSEGNENQTENDVDPLGRQDLILAAINMQGSQDAGNQLFCAMLRSTGVDARLVCSLQPLPFRGGQDKPATPQKAKKPVIRAMPPYASKAADKSKHQDQAIGSSSTIGKVPSARRRLGQTGFDPEPVVPAPTRRVKKKHVRELKYPIFWVEAFNAALQKWTPIDPLVTQTIGKPSKFEPPSSYDLNQMTYVIAFEEDGVARDVTRRYTKAYNAKTRRNRVESTEDGAQWMKKALRLFRRKGGALDRDQTEIAELNQKEAREGLPSNVQDFKDHPTYALERHLKRNEIIQPKREAGKVNAGTAAKPRMEVVYRRADVLVCRSADKWYRLGREIQEGQLPLKHVQSRNPRGARAASADADGGEAENAGVTALYAYYQTEAYVAPPVVDGRIPRNAFGNLDIYVPSMVPPGGTHIRHPLAQQAAKSLRIDYADAVTGFQFKGRHGTAVIQGAIVATTHVDAVNAVIEGLRDERTEEESLARSAMALRMWKRLLTGLRIEERVSAYGDGGEAKDVREEMDRQEDEEEKIEGAGGFFAEEPAMPTAGRFSLAEIGRAKTKAAPVKASKRQREESEEEAEASGAGSEEAAEPNVASNGLAKGRLGTRRSTRARRKVVEEESDEDATVAEPEPEDPTAAQHDDQGGGFLPDEGEDEGGGGFVEEDFDGDDAGGGFLPDVDDDSGGGFVPQELDEGVDLGAGGGFVPELDSKPVDDRQDVPSSRPPEPSGEAAPIQAVGIAPATRSASDIASFQNSGQSVGNTAPLPPAHLPLKTPGQQDSAQKAEHSVAVAQDTEPSSHASTNADVETDQKEVEAAEDPEERSDNDSMLSHDPEDEDAEPDWLESD